MTADARTALLLIGNLTIHFHFSPSWSNPGPIPLICVDGTIRVTRAMARILDITEKNISHPIKRKRLFGSTACFGDAFYFEPGIVRLIKEWVRLLVKIYWAAVLLFLPSGSRKQSSNWFSGRAVLLPVSWWQWGDGDGVTSGNWTQSDTSNHEHDFFQEPNLWMDNQFRRDSVWVSWKAHKRKQTVLLYFWDNFLPL